MTPSLLFLSHIHEEKALAFLVKQAIESEFSGFVEVFVSSDGTSIPAGANFLKRIEDGLVHCVGALYLISPLSVRRPWINFELGSVWIRNAMSVRSGSAEIPALPMCHSGMSLGSLPPPINNLNSIQANQPTNLQFAFKSIQRAVGGKGDLRTDFDALAGAIIAFENEYTFGSDLKEMLIDLSITPSNFAKFADSASAQRTVDVKLGEIDQALARRLMEFIDKKVPGRASYNVNSSGTLFGQKGPINYINIDFSIETDLVRSVSSVLEK